MSIDLDAPIGIFDSGVGGLTVAREIRRQLPKERFLYFGDTARVPYGSKSKDTVLRYTRQVLRFMEEQHVKAVVIACNTASALALEEVKTEMPIPVIGVIKSGALMAAEATRNGRIGIIGTEATIGSGLHQVLIHQVKQEARVYSKACPLFVPLVEEGWLRDPVTNEIAARYLAPLVDKAVDTLVLGCTHYPLLYPVIQQIMGDEVRLVDSAYATAVELKLMLERSGLLRPSAPESENQRYEYFVSDGAAKFSRFAETIIPGRCDATQISVEDY